MMAQKHKLMQKSKHQNKCEKGEFENSTTCEQCGYLQHKHNAVTLNLHHPKSINGNNSKSHSNIGNGDVVRLEHKETSTFDSKMTHIVHPCIAFSPKRLFHLPISYVSARRLYFFGDPHWVYRFPW